MNRTVVALAAAVVLAGCLGTAPPGPVDATPRYESYVFDHGGVDGPVIEGGIRYPDDGRVRVGRSYATVVASREEAGRFDRAVLDDGAASFVENTSFDGSYLVVVQSFPASSVPDYRVERVERRDGAIHLRLNRSSRYATADITVETVLVRVHGEPPDRAVVTTAAGSTFDSAAGVVTRTPEATPTPAGVELPYASDDGSENVGDPRDVRIENRGTDVNGYRLTVTYTGCPAAGSSCEDPGGDVAVLSRTGKLRPGTNHTFADVAARRGTYAISVEAEVPAGDGSRRTVTATFEWRIGDGSGDAVVVVTDDAVRVEETAAPAGAG